MKLVVYITALCLFVQVKCDLNLDDGSPCFSEGLNGTCMSVFRCSLAALTYTYRNAGYSAYSVPKFPEICSYNSKGLTVCCTDCNVHDDEVYKQYVITPNGHMMQKQGPKAYDKCMDYFQNLRYSCRGSRVKVSVDKYLDGTNNCYQNIMTIDTTETLIGGESVKKGELPHMALLGYGTDSREAKWLCGGTIISERFILTAGHCVRSQEYGDVAFAALGIIKRSDIQDPWKVIYNIQRRIRHPDYKPPSKYHDIALLETENEINFGRYILPACLDTLQTDKDDIKRIAKAPGWGELGHKNSLSEDLQIITLERFNESECSAHFPVHRLMKQGFDPNTQLCYGARRDIQDTCNGDSGGPLHIDEKNCLYKIIGVTSFGRWKCGILGTPGIFTRVLPYVPWIESIVWPD